MLLSNGADVDTVTRMHQENLARAIRSYARVNPTEPIERAIESANKRLYDEFATIKVPKEKVDTYAKEEYDDLNRTAILISILGMLKDRTDVTPEMVFGK